MTIEPGNYPLTIYQGATFNQRLIWQDDTQTPIDLTGYTARMMARASQADADPFLTLTTENGGIALGGAAGTIDLYMSDTATAALTAPIGLYDLELESGGGDVTRILQGTLTISKEITR